MSDRTNKLTADEAAFVSRTAEEARLVIIAAISQRPDARQMCLIDSVVGHLTGAWLAARARSVDGVNATVSQFTLFLRRRVPEFFKKNNG